MAGRSSDKAHSGKASADKAVQDASHFLFELDAAHEAPDIVSRLRKSPGDALKPHYHDHRARLRKRFDEAGAGALSDYELLELLLFRTIPRRDTKPLAKALLTRFGDLPAVLAAPVQRIAEVEGAGPVVAQDLKIVQALLERASKAHVRQRTVIGSWSALLNYCRMSMAHAPREQFRVLFLDVKNQLIADEVLNEGTVDHAPVYPREIARRALELSAANVILVHNHPSGDPKPSAADIAVTREIVAAAGAIGVKVHDHLVVGKNGVESFRSLGLL
ncbi:DNA repair protein RadC [Terricaulis sp.]|uniref:RadC family protein n=1 Tax=Terricaulis sp. TaxID=2768686 RepID=UPI0037835D81